MLAVWQGAVTDVAAVYIVALLIATFELGFCSVAYRTVDRTLEPLIGPCHTDLNWEWS